jgi:hypothetical protein
MTKREGAIISAYTGIMIGSFSDMHEYAEEKLARPIFTHEFANEALVKELKNAAKEDFFKLNEEIII